ncbi:iron utilization domain protein [Myxococcus xanthus DK 1622]|uniref:Iron utilization domain protein n=1 Tax=Myxococcus xanthus (strain DK1622) TaxID=246197 RepID=Q1CXW4_MYXXD|nr:iron utilization domain protein [Myxococcus xanthus DK 1622]
METLAPRLRRVCVEGESLKGVRGEPGHEVEFRVGPTAFRHDTPSLGDPARGALEVVFFLHGHGPGSTCRHAVQGVARLARLREARRAQQGLLGGRRAGPLIAAYG